MKTYRIEYLTEIGRLKSTMVSGKSVENAMDAAVESLGIDFTQIQTVELKG